MSKIDDALEQLIEVILGSKEYMEYDAQRNRVNQYPELKSQINAYRERNYLLQKRGENTFERIEQFEREFSSLLDNPLAADFLSAELDFCRMIQDIGFRITDAINFE